MGQASTFERLVAGTLVPVSTQGIGQLNGGPFQVGANLYVLCWTQGGIAIEMRKSTDAGLTWIAIDQAHAPLTDSMEPNMCFDGTHTFWVVNSHTSKMQLVPFNTNTDLWETPTLTTNGSDGDTQSAIGFRSDATIVIVNSFSDPGPPPRGRSHFFVFDSVALTSTAWTACGYVVNDANDCTHTGIFEALAGSWFMQFGVTGTGLSTLYIQEIDSLNTLGVLTSIATVVTLAVFNPPYSDGTNVILAWQPDLSGFGPLQVFEAPLSTLVFVPQIVTPLFGLVNQWSVLTQGGTFYVFLLDDTQTLEQFTDTGAGFNAGVSIIGGVTEDGLITNFTSTNAFGFAIAFGLQGEATSYLAFPVTVLTALKIGGALQFAPFPSIGAVCKFALPKRLQKPTPRVIQIGKEMTYPIGYVR